MYINNYYNKDFYKYIKIVSNLNVNCNSNLISFIIP